MKFEEIRFHGKHQFKRECCHEIMNRVDQTIPGLSPTRLNRYVEILLDDQEFNPKTHVFYDKSINLELDYDFLAGVAVLYIQEHVDEFEFKKLIVEK